MINCVAFDVECFPNCFSITFVNINHYLKIFADIKDNNKPIPLAQKLSVKEIKERLSQVQYWQFYFTPENDEQLLPLVDFLNHTSPYERDGKTYRTDMYGYNSWNYDNLMVAAFLINYNSVTTTGELCIKLYETSKMLVNMDKDKGFNRNDFYYSSLRRYKLPYQGIDVQRIFHLDKASVIVTKEGERKAVPKGLKQTSINLQWYELLEYSLPPINEKEYELHYSKMSKYKGISCDRLTELIDKWDRYLLEDYIPEMLHYNLNDVFIVCELVRLNSNEIKSRYTISNAYGVNVLNSSRSNMADILFTKFYTKFSGLQPYEWQGKKTERTAMAFNKVIFPFIKFKTKELQEMLDDMKKVIIYHTSKDAFSREVKIGNCIYTIATGGLHSQDTPVELWSSNRGEWISPTGEQKENPNDYVYIHADINSMYPSIIAAHGVAPAHLNQQAFCNCIDWMRQTRIKVKHWDEDMYEGIPKDILALVLKIVINSIYGKLGFAMGDIYDRLAVLKTTINGQLMILMLIEELELNGIQVFSANTDGIVVKLYNKDIDKYNQIKDNWETVTKLKFDTDYYECLIQRDVNNYLSQFRVNKKGVHKLELETKGALNPMMYAIDLTKGYDMPIVAEAVKEFFLNNIPVMKTLQSATNILDFCKTQNVGRQFFVEVEYATKDGIKKEEYQRYVRYYVSNHGVVIYKTPEAQKNNSETTTRGSQLAAGQVVTILNTLDDKDISLRDINYKYYYLEAMKIIEPIKLGITPKGKGKTQIRKQAGSWNKLFD